MTPEISIVIPHLNDAENLAKCLASLESQSFDMGRAEIIVVDNGSREPPHAVAARFPRVRLAEERFPGPGPARNRGIALAEAPVLAFTDSDCVVDRDWVAAILARFAREPGTAIIGGDIRIVIDNPERPNMAEAFELVYGFRQHLNIGRHKFSATANLAVRRAAMEAVGPFGGIDISEDLDWGQRAAALGYPTIFADEVVVHHPARRTMAGLYAQWGRHVSHFYRLRCAERFGRLKWAATIPLMALSPLAEVPAILSSERLPGARARGRAFSGLVRVRAYRAQRMLLAMFDEAAKTASKGWNRG